MADDREDLIEAIKRRNEERARKLRERIAKGEFDKFATPLETVDDVLPSGPEAIPAPASDFDLSAFPPPPEPAAFVADEPPTAAPVAAEIGPPDFGPPDIGPPDFGPPDLEIGDLAPPDFGPPELGVAIEAGAPAPEPAPAPPPALEESAAGLELTALDLEGVSEFLAPQTWEGTAPTPEPAAAAAPPATPTAPPVEPRLEIEVETPPAVVKPPAEEIKAAPARPTPPAAEAVPAAATPLLREEEAEAIKVTIEEELREVEPAAPPMPRRPVTPPEVAPAAAPPPPTPAAAKEEAEISIAIEVRGNKVKIERRNITLAAAIDLFKAIINRYENK